MVDGKGKSRESSKQETREALIRAGMTLFSEEGVDLPSLDAICARAGFTRGAFYVHFKDRDDFLEAVVDRVMTDFVTSVVAAGEEGDDLGETIDRFLQAAASGTVPLMGDRALIQQLMARGMQRADNMRAGFRNLLQVALGRLAASAKAAREAGKLKTEVDEDLVAAWLVAAALGLTSLLEAGIELDFNRIRQSARQLLQIEPD
ncbi:MAG: TetR family transcriptional regulator [Myxococcales bacterium]|nr:TetR family transcriptional regulator [Myxococcales bacterium]